MIEHLTVRLFPNRQDVRYVGRIHEQVVSRRPEVTLELIPCGVILHHSGYRSAASRRGKAERDLPILERLAAEEPGDAFAAYNLGVTLSRPRPPAGRGGVPPPRPRAGHTRALRRPRVPRSFSRRGSSWRRRSWSRSGRPKRRTPAATPSRLPRSSRTPGARWERRS